MKFETADEFVDRFDEFWGRVQADEFAPRDYVVENLTLEKCARHYASIVEEVTSECEVGAHPA